MNHRWKKNIYQKTILKTTAGRINSIAIVKKQNFLAWPNSGF